MDTNKLAQQDAGAGYSTLSQEPKFASTTPTSASVSTSGVAAASSPIGTTNNRYPDPIVQYPDAPYQLGVNNNESVSLNSGSLSYTMTDFTVPGKNGLDLVVQRQYNSAHSSNEQPYVDARNKNNGDRSSNRNDQRYRAIVKDKSNKEVYGEWYGYWNSAGMAREHAKILQSIYNGYTSGSDFASPKYLEYYITEAKPNTWAIDRYGLGYGWQFCFPAIEKVPYYKNAKTLYYNRLHLGDGRSFDLDETADRKDKTESGLLKYYQTDMKISLENNVYKLSYKDGRAAYFERDQGKLQYIEDRFGNRIEFSYQEMRLSSITDTYGRVFSLVSDSGMLKWKRNDTGETECSYVTNGSTLTQSLDKLNRRTTYAYTTQQASMCLAQSWPYERNGVTYYDSDRPRTFTYFLLSSVTHPTGAYSEYRYNLIKENTGSKSFMDNTFRDYYVIINRCDYETTAKAKAYNQINYEYKLNENNRHIKTATETFANGSQITQTFDSSRMCTSETVTANGKTVSQTNFTYYGEENGSYTFRNLPHEKSTTTYKYNGSAVETSGTVKHTWVYKDINADISSETVAYSRNNAAPFLTKTTSMEYDDAYHLLTKKIYKKDDSTQMVEDYELTGDKKLVQCARLYENNALKQLTRFVYSGNQLVEEQRYPTPNNQAVYLSTFYEYTAKTPQPTKTEKRGVRDVNGALVTSPYGSGVAREQVSYDWYGRPVETINTLGYSAKVGYDAVGRIISETDFVGVVKTYTYKDAQSYILVTEDANGKKIQRKYQYDSLGGILAIKDYLSEQNQVFLIGYEYDAAHRVSAELTYHANGTVESRTAYAYDGLDRVTKQTVSGVNTEENWAYHDYFATGHISAFSMVKHTVVHDDSALSVITCTVLDPDGNVLVEGMGTAASDSFTPITTNHYDLLGNKKETCDALNNRVTWEYNHAGQVVKESKWLDGRAINTTYTYDGLGRNTYIHDCDTKETKNDYDDLDRLVMQQTPFSTARGVTKYHYDMAGNLKLQETLCGATGQNQWRKVSYDHDKCGRVTDTVLFEDNGAENRTEYVYDSLGNKTTVITGIIGDAKGHITRYTYTRFGEVETVTDPLGYVERMTYDSVNRLIRKTDRSGAVITYSYDALRRVTGETAVKNGKTSAITHSYFKTGLPKVETSEALTVSYRYDSWGRLVEQTEGNVVKSYTYYNNGNRETFTLKRGTVTEISLRYTYDSLNRLLTVVRGGTSIATYAYNDIGTRKSLTLGNGTITNYLYNDANLVTSLVTTGSNATRCSYSYTYLMDGNQSAKTDRVANKTTAYTYDAMGRLKQEDNGETATKMVYAYDAFGNRSKTTVTGAETNTTDYTYNANNWLTHEVRKEGKATITTLYRYDKNGNQVYRETEILAPVGTAAKKSMGFQEDLETLETMEYNGFNQLQRVNKDGKVTSYLYRPDGLRHSKTVEGKTTIHLWDGQDIVADIASTGSVANRYLRGQELIARHQDNLLYYYLHNAHGDVVQTTDQGGGMLKKYVYDAFGVEWQPNKLDVNPFRYCGEYYDGETGRIYLRARYYEPGLGRFVAEDVAKDGRNWYSYCKNNPVLYFDPLGLREYTQYEIDKMNERGRHQLAAAERARNDALNAAARQDRYDAMRNGTWSSYAPASSSNNANATSSNTNTTPDINHVTDASTREQLLTLHPAIRDDATNFILDAQAEGITLRIPNGDGYRTFERQQEVYDSGASRALPGQGYHNYGLALDVYEVLEDGSINWNISAERQQQIADIAAVYGFEWGGDWTGGFVDPPHFEKTFGYGWSELLTRYNNGNIVNGYVNLN